MKEDGKRVYMNYIGRQVDEAWKDCEQSIQEEAEAFEAGESVYSPENYCDSQLYRESMIADRDQQCKILALQALERGLTEGEVIEAFGYDPF